MSKSDKLPYMPFYIGDWKKDAGVQLLNFHDRHVWFEMLMVMHDMPERGVLRINGNPLSTHQVSQLINLDNQIFLQALEQIESLGICSRDSDGAIYSRSMVKRYQISLKRKISGSQGGSPNLVNQKSEQGGYANADIDIDNVIDIDLDLKFKELDTPEIRAELKSFILKVNRDSHGKNKVHQQTLDNWQSAYRGRPADFLDALKFSNSRTKCVNLIERDNQLARAGPKLSAAERNLEATERGIKANQRGNSIMKLEQMAVIMAQASSVFSNFTLTKEAIKTWQSLFANEDFESFHAALRICIKEPGRSFFPTPGEVNKIILKMKRAHLPDADEVWSTLLRYAGGGDSASAYKYLLGNSAGQRALDRVTFHSLRYADIETELPWIRKEFINSYNETSESIENKESVYIGRDEVRAILNGPLKQLLAKGVQHDQ